MNTKILKFVYGGPKLNFTGLTGQEYIVNSNQEIVVFEEDAEYLLSLEKHNRKYFALVEDTLEDEPEPTLTAGADEAKIMVEKLRNEDFDDVVDLMDDFTVIDGVGESLNEKLQNEGLDTFEDLVAKGEEWLSGLPRISEEKAKSIYSQAKQKLEELKY
jgi:predicted flap endonuclease-1-like 5' DNA nuclease